MTNKRWHEIKNEKCFSKYAHNLNSCGSSLVSFVADSPHHKSCWSRRQQLRYSVFSFSLFFSVCFLFLFCFFFLFRLDQLTTFCFIVSLFKKIQLAIHHRIPVVKPTQIFLWSLLWFFQNLNDFLRGSYIICLKRILKRDRKVIPLSSKRLKQKQKHIRRTWACLFYAYIWKQFLSLFNIIYWLSDTVLSLVRHEA